MDNTPAPVPNPINEYVLRRRYGIVEEAHRQRPPVCGAPALIWHLGLWPKAKWAGGDQSYVGEDPQDAKTDQQYNERLIAWVGGINATLSRLKDLDESDQNLQARRDTRVEWETDPAGLALVTRPIVEFTITWMGMQIDVLTEGHHDFITFSLLLDIEKNRKTLKPNGALLDGIAVEHPFAKVEAALARIASVVAQEKRKLEVSGALTAAGNTPQAMPTLPVQVAVAAGHDGDDDWTRDLYQDFWMSLRNAALAKAGLGANADLFPGEPFAKFFGVALTAGEDTATDTFDELNADDKNARAVIKTHWPFISLANAKADERDFVACSMLDKRAIYVTAMGARPKRKGDDKPEVYKTPYPDVQDVRYIIFVRPSPNTFQLGRLIEHINTMGTIRFFALKELMLFRRLGTSIRLYGHYVDIISTRFNELLEQRKDVLDTESEEELKVLSETTHDNGTIRVGKEKVLTVIADTGSIRFLQTVLCRLEAELFQYSAQFTGGLPFRVSRSKFYVRIFKDRLPDLNIRPIMPYQSYTQFVKRRLYSTFDYVTDIGDRVTALRTRLKSLLDSIQSKALIDLTLNISKLTQATVTQTESLILIQDYTRDQVKSLVSIQDDSRREVEATKNQTDVLYLIAVFAFLGQIMQAVLWSISDDEAGATMTAFTVAGVLSLLFFFLRRALRPANDKPSSHKTLTDNRNAQLPAKSSQNTTPKR